MTPQRQLFRHEAVDFQRQDRIRGQVAALQPLSMKVTTWFLTSLLIVVILFLLVAEYSRKETAVGYLTPTTGTSKIFVPQRGTIREVHVEEGDVVQEGQALLTIDTKQIAADGVDVHATQLETLLAQKQLLAKNIASEEERAGSEHERLTSLIRGFEAEISQLQSQIQLQSERLLIAESEVSSSEQLRMKGYTTAVEVKRRQLQMLELKQAVSALNQQLTAKRNQLVETRYSLSQLPTLMAQKVQALRNELSATEQRTAEIKGRGAYVIRAPASGRVSTLQATVGQNADPQRLQLEIIPEHAAIKAELFIPARAIGFVKPGQAVRILYEAFPYQHFGTYSGKVIKVSQTILTNSDAAGPIALKEPAYRVTAALDRTEIDAHGTKVALQPDMLLRADIILEKRSLMSWLLSPVSGIRM